MGLFSNRKERDQKELEKLLTPLIRAATKMQVTKPARPMEQSQLSSHFGGHPYFKTGDNWPKSKNGRDLAFIFQVFNGEGISLPSDIQLIQFFYDWDEF